MFTRRKKLFIILSSFLAVIIVATIVVMVLRQTQTPAMTINTLSANELVSGIEDSLRSGPAKSYVFQPAAPDNYVNIFAKSTSSSTVLLTTTKNFVEFSKASIIPADEFSALETTITSYFKNNDFIESRTIDSSSTVLRYSRADADCQVSRFIIPDNLTTIKLACIDRTDAETKLRQIDMLLELWKEKSSFDYISQDSVSDATYELRILSAVTVVDPTKLHTLLFINDKGTWKYLGDASQGDPSLSNSKYILNSDITKAMADPGYGGLVTTFLPTTKK